MTTLWKLPRCGTAALALFCLLMLVSQVQALESFYEVFSVSGCHDDESEVRAVPRRTRQCFTDATDTDFTLQLGIQGKFPALPPEQHFVVELIQADDLFIVSDPIDDSFAEAPHSIIPARIMCTSAAPSTLFATQLIHCNLSHPGSLVGSGEISEESFSFFRENAVWMDVVLYSATENDERTTLAIVRRAVEIDISRAGVSADSGEKDESAWLALETLFDTEAGGWSELGVGGLHKELQTLLRRVFLSRLPALRNVSSALQLPHVRGVILHGKPGTGKTLIARTFAHILGSSAKLSIIHAPDILSKYVGESERNLLRVFRGEEGESPKDILHVIVIDELETLFVRRDLHDGSSAASVYEGVTNTLLSLMDGIHHTNDILVIGITNRIDAVDAAMLRPGRFEVVIEIPEPDTRGLAEIFTIHSEKLQQSGLLDPSLDVLAVAKKLSGFSGADVAGVVRSAVSLASGEYVLRHRQGSEEGFLVTTSHIEAGINEIRRGKSTAASDPPRPLSIVDFDGTLHTRLEQVTSLFQAVEASHSGLLNGVAVLQGPASTGKTTAAREIFNSPVLNVTHKRFVSCRSLIKSSLEDAVRSIVHTLQSTQTFSEDDHTTLIVLDDFDVLFDTVNLHYPVLATMLKNALHAFTHVGSDESHSSAVVKRLLVLTTSQPLLGVPGVRADITVSLHRVHRSGLFVLLPYYRIFRSTDTESIGLAASGYPASMSLGYFLRITKLAIWQMMQNGRSVREGFAFSEQTGVSTDANECALEGRESAKLFAAAVRETVASMGGSDSFHGVSSEMRAGEAVEEVLW